MPTQLEMGPTLETPAPKVTEAPVPKVVKRSKVESKSDKPSRRAVLNGIMVDRIYSGTDRVGLGDFLHRIITWSQRTGHRRNPENTAEETVNLNAPLLQHIREFLEAEAPDDYKVERQGAFISPDERRPVAAIDEATIESISAAVLIPVPFGGLPAGDMLDLRQRDGDDFQVSFGDPDKHGSAW